MCTKIPTIGVAGRKDSGKTAVVESMVRALRRKGYRVATVKHVNQKGFSLDTAGKDTWRYSQAGANPVVSVSDIETGILIKAGAKELSLGKLLHLLPETDLLILEGFSWLTLNDKDVGKILCVRNRDEYENYRKEAKGAIIAFCSIQSLGKPILRTKEDSKVLVKQTLGFIKKKLKTSEIHSLLPGLDCGKCGHSTCEEMAIAIYEEKMKLSNCFTLGLGPKLKTKIIVNNVEVPIQLFVSEIIGNSILGMISSLKGVSIEGNEEVHVEISG